MGNNGNIQHIPTTMDWLMIFNDLTIPPQLIINRGLAATVHHSAPDIAGIPGVESFIKRSRRICSSKLLTRRAQ